MFQGWKDALHGYWGKSRGKESSCQVRSQIKGPCGPVITMALLCSGKERPRRLWAGCPWDRIPVVTATWKQRLPARC